MPVRVELFRIVLRHGIEVENALEPTLEFLDAYPSTVADDASPTESFGEGDLRRANRGGARISAAEIAAVLERKGEIDRWLREISPDASLAGAARSIPWGALTGLFEVFSGIRGIGLSKVTKMLHSKRPALIPMLDSVVQAYLTTDDADPGSSEPFGERATALVRRYKDDLDRNPAPLRELSARARRSWAPAQRSADPRPPDLVRLRGSHALTLPGSFTLATARHPGVRISRVRSHRGGGWGYRSSTRAGRAPITVSVMSMNGNFRALPDEELQTLLADPSRVEQLLYASLFGGGSNGRGDELEVDKAWHGLHFLLTGTAWEGSFPLNFIVVGGQEVGDDLGYGPARALRSDDVRKIDAALEPLTPEELGRRFDDQRMTELQIYPDGWTHDPDGELEYLLEFYTEPGSFVRRTAGRGHALLVYLS